MFGILKHLPLGMVVSKNFECMLCAPVIFYLSVLSSIPIFCFYIVLFF